jgi:hypothetical protein
MVFVLVMALAALPLRVQGETFLPPQDIHLSGRVTAQSCTASVNTTELAFTTHDRQAPQPMNMGNATQGQLLVLQLHACNPSGVGVKFTADTMAGYPERGLLRQYGENTPNASGYYTVGLATQTEWQMMLAADSAALINGEGKRFYFRLDGTTYWFDASPAQLRNTRLQLPFRIDAHIWDTENAAAAEKWLGKFTLNLSYR